MLGITDEPWTGDLDAMVDRQRIRALVTFSKTFYFLDGVEQRGLSFDALKEFEKTINKKLKTKHLKVHMVFIPVARNELLPALVEGRGDIAAANLTITPQRQEIVDFSDPLLTDVEELLVTGPSAPEITTLDDLVGAEVFVRPSSSYYESLRRLSTKFKEQGIPRLHCGRPTRISKTRTSSKW